MTDLLRIIFLLIQIILEKKGDIRHGFVCLSLDCRSVQISLLHDGQNSEKKYSSKAKWTGNITAKEYELQPVQSC